MSVVVEFDERHVRIRLHGLDQFWALSRGITVPIQRVRTARAVPRREAVRESSKLRLPGSSVPGNLRAGSYGLGADRQFWCVHRAEELLVLDLFGRPYSRIVVEVRDPRSLARTITAARVPNRT